MRLNGNTFSHQGLQLCQRGQAGAFLIFNLEQTICFINWRCNIKPGGPQQYRQGRDGNDQPFEFEQGSKYLAQVDFVLAFFDGVLWLTCNWGIGHLVCGHERVLTRLCCRIRSGGYSARPAGE